MGSDGDVRAQEPVDGPPVTIPAQASTLPLSQIRTAP
ncbi:hypothetical protein ABH935_006883 [Catenulispora sp. GAS73]